MGKFIYGTPSVTVDFDDRVLAHLKVVIVAKLRRGESLMLNWETPENGDMGHSSVWLNPSIPLQFDFEGKREPEINRVWLEELVKLANTPAGLRVTPEPEQPELSNK